MGRPQKKIDADIVFELAKINCTMHEIAAVVKCSVDTLERRFADIIKIGREDGKASLKRRMWETAMSDSNKGSVTMQIWLSKQILGYTDKVEQNVSSELQASVIYNTQFGNTNPAALQSASNPTESSPIQEKV